MREILFRGKRLDTGEWVEGCFVEKKDPLLESDVRNAFILAQARGDSFVTWFPVDPATVGQFTGLLANGKRIFEGDILKDDWGKIFEVFFSTKTCSFMANLKIAPSEWETGNYRLGEAWTDTVKIISNIHDPELLEVTHDE